ncbi:DUF3293 domain-containing protein [Deinococcus maricopensis]|uniref:DUF3293 domain-containing protein n=1 Tax=Deinococcus maricopensis (strain DSM 21211 / LMG 22137 / NRRL B-23946 / LB-34) TaxID=709986 RepID=E8U8I7_DEIML|nr:DUF3293 domain-containing protein [Deinococcus maricopensis]ADV67376.1 hypothetical protein Deima_1727 [Deinococcus maricopensis DSM 21211]
MRTGEALRAAFLNATYGTRAERFRLSGVQPARLASPSWAAGGRAWAVVTAWNPGGQLASAEVNARADGALREQVDALGVPSRVAVNGDGRWREASLLLEGARLRDAVALGRHFGQAAVVFGVGARAALVWCGPDGVRVERLWASPSARP